MHLYSSYLCENVTNNIWPSSTRWASYRWATKHRLFSKNLLPTLVCWFLPLSCGSTTASTIFQWKQFWPVFVQIWTVLYSASELLADIGQRCRDVTDMSINGTSLYVSLHQLIARSICSFPETYKTFEPMNKSSACSNNMAYCYINCYNSILLDWTPKCCVAHWETCVIERCRQSANALPRGQDSVANLTNVNFKWSMIST